MADHQVAFTPGWDEGVDECGGHGQDGPKVPQNSLPYRKVHAIF